MCRTTTHVYSCVAGSKSAADLPWRYSSTSGLNLLIVSRPVVLLLGQVVASDFLLGRQQARLVGHPHVLPHVLQR